MLFDSSGGSGRVSGGVQGVSGRRLGGSWGCPGRIRGRLGRDLGALGAILERSLAQSDFGSIFDRFWTPKGCQKGRIWGGQREPESIPKRPPNDPKSKTIWNSDKNNFQDRLGAVLGRF